MAEGTELRDHDEVLNRQVHPGQWDTASGKPMLTAFGPQTADRGLMSTLRGRVEANEAFRRHTVDHRLKSVGTWGVRVGDAIACELPCIDDGGSDGNPVDHASVDFRSMTRPQMRVARRKLHEESVRRGPLYEPSGDDEA